MAAMEKLFGYWKTGEMNKHQFIEAIHQYHRVLFQYSRHLQGNIVESLHITASAALDIQA